MAFGVTSTGFLRKTFADIRDAIQTRQRDLISKKLSFSERTVIGNLNSIFADELAQTWELAEEAYHAFDPDNASDDRIVALALISGVRRRSATKGLVTATVNLDASQSFAAGELVAHVTDEPSNRWINRDAVTSTTAGNYSAVFESESAGADAVAPSGTLAVIATSTAGWNSITNATDATPGTDQESIEDLQARREQSLARAGSGTVKAVQADVAAIDEVISVLVLENTSHSTDADGVPPHSIRVIVWDGSTPAAADADIAQAIYDSKAAGIYSHGAASGIATNADGQDVNIFFDRATEVPLTITVQIESAVGVAIDDVKNAIIALAPDQGDDVIFNRLASSVFDVEGVDDWTTFTVNGGTVDIAIANDEIATIDSSNITVTGDAS